MDKALQTMIENLHKKSGKTLDQWINIVNKQKIQNMEKNNLKDNHGLTMGLLIS